MLGSDTRIKTGIAVLDFPCVSCVDHQVKELTDMKRMIVLLGLAVLLTLGILNVASAHAKLDHCTPAIGTNVATAPSQVVCVFSEEIDTKASTLSVWDANNQQVDKKDAHVDLNDPNHATLIASLDTSLVKDGVYTVKWHAVTPDDGGISDGTWQFAVGTVAVTPQPATEVVNPATATPPGNVPAGTPTEGAATAVASATSAVASPTAVTVITAATPAPQSTATSTVAAATVPATVPTTGSGINTTGILVLLALAIIILAVGGVVLRARG